MRLSLNFTDTDTEIDMEWTGPPGAWRKFAEKLRTEGLTEAANHVEEGTLVRIEPESREAFGRAFAALVAEL